MADGFGAVIDASVKVIAICSQYSNAVVSARADIIRLESQVKSLKTTLDQAAALIEPSNKPPLAASRDLLEQLHRCETELQELQIKLELRTARKAMRKVGLRALKWPFSSEETEAKIRNLEQYQRRIMDGLQIDQTNLLLNIKTKVETLSLSANEDISIALKPRYMLLFPRDADFIKRPDIQTWIMDQYNNNTSRIALVGLGGFGKSQLAIEFAYEVHCASPDHSIFWVQGNTRATFEESYQTIADELALPSRHESKINILALVRNWLQRKDVAPWLMILDNADNMNTFFAKSEGTSIAAYLPKTSHGKILVTSRNLSVAERLTGSHKAIKQISTMGNAEALRLLENKLVSNYDQHATETLVGILDFVPLAVNQAAAYINRRDSTIQSYIDRFQKSEKQKTSLLNYDAGDIRRHEDVSHSVVMTWQVTFEQIRQERPAAASLLSLISLFQPQNIPKKMLSRYRYNTVDPKSEDDESEILEDNLNVLLGYSLIKTSGTAGFYETHSLVQFCTRIWLVKLHDLERWKILFLRLASAHFPSGNFETWAMCQILLSHIKSTLEEQPVDKQDFLKWSRLQAKVSRYMIRKGTYYEAERLSQRAVKAQISVLGPNHSHTLRSWGKLKLIYWKQGRWEEARKLQMQVLEICKTKLEDDHPDTLTSMVSIAAIYRDQGWWEEAEKLQMQVLETRKTKLGADHPHTLAGMNDLASTYLMQRRWEEAEKLQVQVLETHKTKFGNNHPNTRYGINILAFILRVLRRSDEDLDLMQNCVSRRKRVLGPEHRYTKSTLKTVDLWERENTKS